MASLLAAFKANATPSSYGAAIDDDDDDDGVLESAVEDESPSLTPSSTYVENAKYLLIVCIVWVHALEDFLSRAVIVDAESWSVRKTKIEVLNPMLPYFRAWYLTLGLFVMPLFTIIAGYQSKSWLEIARGHDTKAHIMLKKIRHSSTSLLGGWVVWQALYVLVDYPTVRPLQWWSPVGVTWFLLALYIWRSSVLLFGGMKDGFIYTFVIAVAVLAGFTDTPVTANGLRFLDWQRTCTFGLYFYVGLVAVKRKHVDATLDKFTNMSTWLRVTVGWAAVGVIFGAFRLAEYLGVPFDEVEEWVFVASPYGFSSWYHSIREAALRVVLYLCVIFASMAFMLTVPVEKYWFTSYGSRTIVAYLLHRVLLNAYDELCTSFWDDDDISVSFQITMGVFVLPLVVSQVSLAPPVLKLLSPLIDPVSHATVKTPWLFNAADDARASGMMHDDATDVHVRS